MAFHLIILKPKIFLIAKLDEKKEKILEVAAIITDLELKELDTYQQVVRLRLGLAGEKKHYFRQIGEKLGFSKTTSREAYVGALQVIADAMNSDELKGSVG